MQTSYWPGEHRGGCRRRGTAIELIKQMIDDLHAWYHSKPAVTAAKVHIGAIHVYDSIVVLEKALQTETRPHKDRLTGTQELKQWQIEFPSMPKYGTCYPQFA